MENNKSMEVFAKAQIRKAVLQNALPAMAAMLMVLIYSLADTFSSGKLTTICRWRQFPFFNSNQSTTKSHRKRRREAARHQ